MLPVSTTVKDNSPPPPSSSSSLKHRLHLISRIPEVSDFNYITYLTSDPNECLCSPSVALVADKEGYLALQVYMNTYHSTVTRTVSTRAGQHADTRKRTPVLLEVPPIRITRYDTWMHCVVQVAESWKPPPTLSTVYSTTPTSSTSLSTAVEETTTLSVFVDGVLADTVTALGGGGPVYQNVLIGSLPVLNGGTDGRLDDFERLNREVQLGEVYWLSSCPIELSTSNKCGIEGGSFLPTVSNEKGLPIEHSLYKPFTASVTPQNTDFTSLLSLSPPFEKHLHLNDCLHLAVSVIDIAVNSLVNLFTSSYHQDAGENLSINAGWWL